MKTEETNIFALLLRIIVEEGDSKMQWHKISMLNMDQQRIISTRIAKKKSLLYMSKMEFDIFTTSSMEWGKKRHASTLETEKNITKNKIELHWYFKNLIVALKQMNGGSDKIGNESIRCDLTDDN